MCNNIPLSFLFHFSLDLLFIGSTATHIFSFMKYLFKSFAIFASGHFCCCCFGVAFLRWSLTLLPRLKYSGAISTHCTLPSWAQVILPTQSPSSWGYRHVQPYPANFLSFVEYGVLLCWPGWSGPPGLK